MSRGQAAVVMCRMNEVVNKAAAEPSVDPEPTPTPPATTGLWSLKNGKAATPENVIEMLKEIEKQYPTGTEWTDPETNPNTLYNSNPVSQTAADVMMRDFDPPVSTKYGCGAFAVMVSDMIFPEEAKLREVTDFSKVRLGDIVFDIKKDGSVAHVWVVTCELKKWDEVDGGWWCEEKAEGNNGNQVTWNYFGTVSPGCKIYTRYPD